MQRILCPSQPYVSALIACNRPLNYPGTILRLIDTDKARSPVSRPAFFTHSRTIFLALGLLLAALASGVAKRLTNLTVDGVVNTIKTSPAVARAASP